MSDACDGCGPAAAPEILETANPEEGVANDQVGPAVTDNFQAAGYRAAEYQPGIDGLRGCA